MTLTPAHLETLRELAAQCLVNDTAASISADTLLELVNSLEAERRARQFASAQIAEAIQRGRGGEPVAAILAALE